MVYPAPDSHFENFTYEEGENFSFQGEYVKLGNSKYLNTD